MRFIDRPLAVAGFVFLLGSLAGGSSVLMVPIIRAAVITLIQARMVTPMQRASQFGDSILLLLVFANNSIPAILSFAYPLAIAKIRWSPPLTLKKRCALMSCFTFLCAFLLGFFGFGAGLSIGWLLGGRTVVLALLYGAWVHGPLEIIAVLLCVSEPMRLSLAERRARISLTTELRRDRELLLICLLALLIAAAIEIFLRA
jgi:hypothetical protein